jgi:hypothetical protein
MPPQNLSKRRRSNKCKADDSAWQSDCDDEPSPPTKKRRVSKAREGERYDIPDQWTPRKVLDHVVKEINQFAWTKREVTRTMFYRIYETRVSTGRRQMSQVWSWLLILQWKFPKNIEKYCKDFNLMLVDRCPGYVANTRMGLRSEDRQKILLGMIIFYVNEFDWSHGASFEEVYSSFKEVVSR